MKFNCVICNKEFVRFGKQIKTAKCCSSECSGKLKKGVNNISCLQCKKDFHKKPSAKTNKHGNFCSNVCYGAWKSLNLRGVKNPNFRNKMYDQDGSRIVWSDTLGRIKMHHAVVFEYLDILKLPKGFSVHHRDCNHQNNTIENLAVLSFSDHKWLHKQYGNATLWAFYNKKVKLEDLISWSNDKERAKRLLTLNIIEQKLSGVFKQGELLENPIINNEGNQQPSLGSNTFEGSTTNSRVLTSNVEDSNANTSALPPIVQPPGLIRFSDGTISGGYRWE